MNVIYQIRNLTNQKIYIGHTINFKRRKRNHIRLLRNGKHHSRHLQSAFKIDGEGNFVFEILETVETPETLPDLENKYIDELNPDYNMMRNVFSHLGMKRSKETCEKISKALTGKKLSPETKEKVRQANLGKKYSEETKSKHSIRSLRPILQFDLNGNLIKEWAGASVAAKELGISAGAIRDCAYGFKKTYKKSIWKLKIKV